MCVIVITLRRSFKLFIRADGGDDRDKDMCCAVGGKTLVLRVNVDGMCANGKLLSCLPSAGLR